MALEPIVVAKPVRGREMRSTFIPKDMIDTMRAVSAKTVKKDVTVNSLQKPREGEIEIYHEGYIDGKLYLVPDSNLQAMRDIVNLKMRRRNSSQTKPQTSLDEPSQYTEFASKLDTLLEKIDELAKSSDDDVSYESRNVEEFQDGKTDEEKERNDIIDTADQQSNDQKNAQKKRSVLQKSQNLKHTTDEKDAQLTVDPDTEFYDKNKSGETTFHLVTDDTDQLIEDRKVIPPILDENIRYKRVKSMDSSKRKYTEDGLDLMKPISSHDKYNQHMDDENFTIYRDTDTDIFRLMISGHLKCGMTPVFIIHRNYNGQNILGNQVPDFKSHKKDGNIDIYISGKFFTENILIEDSKGAPVILSIKPYKMFLDNNSTVHKEKFKDVYSVGPVDIALEGEFIRNSVTSSYTPVLSMEIMKHILSKESQINQTPFTVLYSKESLTKILNDDQTGESSSTDAQTTKKRKHVHYAESNEETRFKENNEDEDSKEIKSLFKKIKGTKLYKKLFVQNKDNLKDISNSENDLLANVRLRNSKYRKKGTSFRSAYKERKIKENGMRRQNRAQEDDSIIPGLHTSIAVYRANQGASSPFTPGSTASGENASNITGDGSKANTIHLGKKKKKRDKNQAIVENPILAQMQEFFIT